MLSFALSISLPVRWFMDVMTLFVGPSACSISFPGIYRLGVVLSLADICFLAVYSQSVLVRPCIEPTALFRPMIGVGIRFGEASNPGPGTLLRCGITNPTCVSNKFDAYWDLLSSVGCNIVSLSETAATATVQSNLTSKFKAKKCKILWSPPAQPLTTTTSGAVHTRGRASGVALLAKVPCRPSRLELPRDFAFSTRITHGIVQFGQSHIQIVVLYCKPVHGQQGVEFNSALMRCALDLVKVVPLPYIVMGDFNMKATQFDSWDELAAQGCRDLTQIHRDRFGTDMDPTCNGVTCPDNAILSPQLVGCVDRIQVLEPTWFATHCPVIFDVRISGHTIFQHQLRLPKSFVDLSLDDDALDNMDSDQWFNDVSSLQEWAGAVEHGVHMALVAGAGNRSSLPKSFRGRCTSVKVVKSPVNSPVGKACDGSYEPSTEVLSMPCRRKVKQTRRVEALFRRVKKLSPDPQTPLQSCQVPNGVWLQLLGEWNAICISVAFGCSFPVWLSQFPDMDFPAYPLPSAAWLFEAFQVSKHYVECALRDDLKIQQVRHGFAQHLDKANHCKAAFARIRGPGPPPVIELCNTICFDVLVVSHDCLCSHDLFASEDDLLKLDPRFPVLVNGHSCAILRVESHHALVSTACQQDWTDCIFSLEQRQLVVSPGEVASAMTKYWLPIWQKVAHPLDFLSQNLEQQSFHRFLDQIPTPPELQLDLRDMDIWSKCIKKLKSASARGTDGISAQELKMLPPAAIRSLAKIIDESQDPFGENFMIGLVAPLSKAGDQLPCPAQTRPITILPQLYRLVASVLCCQIARFFAGWAPPSITGFLPSRGAVTAALQAQYDIELSRFRAQALGGLVLDLKKCFNHISWRFAFFALLKCGVPRRFLCLWILMQSRLERFWLIGGETFLAGTGTSGLPEGDQWSVMAMVAVSIGWVTFLESQVPGDQSAKMTAYADNWGWSSLSVDLHPHLLQQTIAYTAEVGLSLDWDKTWFWTTSKSHARILDVSLAQVAPVPVTQRLSAADLGFQMQYGLKNKLGIYQDRLHAALNRISRLSALRYPLSIKERLLQASIYPVVFHGTETKPPVQESFARLRSAAARALYGDAHTISPGVALLFGKTGILDPEYAFLHRLISTLRRFVARLPPEDAMDFFRIASRFHGSLGSVHGPAAALAFSLQQIGWQVTATGVIHVTGFLSFGFLSVSAQRFRRFLTLAWQYQLVQSQTCRYSWFQFPDISVCDTRAVLSEFHDKQRALLVREIAGGYQLETQKLHWSQEVTGQCPFCPAMDSRRHRLVECPLGSDIRSNFAGVLAELETEGSVIPDFPVVCVHPCVEALTLAHYQRASNPWGMAVQNALHTLHDMGLRPRFFTDGSCQFPTSPTTRYAAWAVVLDLCHNDAERVHIADSCCFNAGYSKAFQVVATDLAEGEQDILRSELLAICDVCENTDRGDVFVDSESAILLASLAIQAQSRLEFLDREHFDVLCRIHSRRDHLDINFIKVKSHRDISSVRDPLDRYAAMGNDIADSTAETTRDKLIPPFAAQHAKFHAELTQDKRCLLVVFSLHLQLFEQRGKALQGVDGSVPLVDSHNIWALFRDWQVQLSAFIMPEVNLELLSFSAFGLDIATITYQWLSCLRWPPDEVGPGTYNVGTTWVELAVDWMCYNQQFLPILRQDQTGTLKLRTIASYAEAVELQFAGTMLEKILRNITALIPQQVMPSLTRKKCGSLYVLGASRYFQGFPCRIQLARQTQVVDLLQKTLQTETGDKTLTSVPPFRNFVGECIVFDHPWTKRCADSEKGMYRCRKLRRDL